VLVAMPLAAANAKVADARGERRRAEFGRH
jgi:hypothetical protein